MTAPSEFLRNPRMRTVTLLAAIQFTVIVDEAAVPLLGPVIADDLDLGEVSRHILVTPFAVAFVIVLPLAGLLVCTPRPQRYLAPSLLLFAASASSLSLAHSPPWLIWSRAAQGAAAAAVATTVLASLHATTRYDARRGAAFGMFSLFSGSGAVVSLVVLGPLAGLSWRWCSLAIGMLAGVLSAVCAVHPRTRPVARCKVSDHKSSSFHGDTEPIRTTEPSVSARTSFCAVVAANTALSAATLTMSFELQQTFSWSPGAVGLAFLPLNAAVALAIAYTVRTRLADSTGARLLIGLCLLTGGCGLIVPAAGASEGAWIACAGIVVGLGLGIVVPLANDGTLAGEEESAMRRAAWLGFAQQAGLGTGALAAASHQPVIFIAVPAVAGALALTSLHHERRTSPPSSVAATTDRSSGRKR